MSMQIEKLPEADEITLPMPLYQSVAIAEAVSKDGARFTIRAGLDRAMADELRRRSLDERDTDVQDKTSDRKRFGGLESYEKWYSKDRSPFALVHDETGALAAIAWFGPEALTQLTLERASQFRYTIAYRSYAEFRGKGLMTSFVKFVLDFHKKNIGGNTKYWAAIHSDNSGSIALAIKLGFKTLPKEIHDDPDQVILLLD